ncbi:MAG: ornithine carbamoyltransferase [Planctomycetaceae bacterium]|nr:ornithine carbamoyltransferase [Planctomycetaceae bacterium]
MRHVLTLFDLSTSEIEAIFALATTLKKAHASGIREPRFAGHVQALLFEKPSLRTRVSFETAFAHLGGTTMYLGADVGWGQRESPADFARVLTQYVDVVVCRANEHARVEQLAAYASCPVINGLTDRYHPCQALADLFTLLEVHGRLAGLKLAYVGDANNVAHSLAVACAHLQVRFAIAAPADYQFDTAFLELLEEHHPSLDLQVTTNPLEAVRDADGVYTDVWVSMGQEAQRQERIAVLRPYQVNGELMAAAPSRARFMHCLPAHRGEEVTDEVIDGPQSIVVPQAANRMHLQKGLLAWILAQ